VLESETLSLHELHSLLPGLASALHCDNLPVYRTLVYTAEWDTKKIVKIVDGDEDKVEAELNVVWYYASFADARDHQRPLQAQVTKQNKLA
jgi:hypothetical protein